MSSESQDNQPFSSGIVSGLLQGLKHIKETCEFSDAHIVIDNFEFQCHRVILAACSGFFKAIFTSGMKEDLERKVILQEITRETFADVLECMYAGRNIINENNMFEIWHAANQLQILFLLHECEVFLKQKINTDNCLAVYQHGKLLDSKEMVEFSWSYIVDNFETVRRSEELMMLTKEEMEKLIANPDLKTVSEDHVLETVLSWIDYKPIEHVDETDKLIFMCDTSGQTQTEVTLSETSSEVSQHLESNNEISQSLGKSTQKDSQNNLEPPLFEGKLTDTCSAVNEGHDGLLEDEQRNGHQQLQTEGTLSQDQSEVIMHQEVPLEDDKRNNHKQQMKSCSRADHLTDLLKLTRVCLLSGKCLMKTMKTAIVRTNTAAQEILQDAFEYILRADGRHGFCPASAIHRSVSHLENVVVATDTGNSTNVLVCRRQNGQWCGLGNNMGTYYYWPLITSFNSDVFLTTENAPMHVYETSRNSWKAIPNSTHQEKSTCLLTVGNFLYAVRGNSENYSVEMINAVDRRQWIKVCPLPSDIGSINCSTVFGDNLIFFGSIAGKSETLVVIFNTNTLQCLRLSNVPLPSLARVCFSNGKNSFVLQKDGTLFRIQACPDEPFIEIVYETMLWDFDRDIKGALLFNEELWLFGPSFSTIVKDTIWELSIPGVFKCVRNIICCDRYSCFVNAVFPKEYLYRPIS